MSVTWLHVSDFHLSPVVSTEHHVAEHDRVLMNLCEKVRSLREEGSWKPDLIFATGDIAHQGNTGVFKAKGAGKKALATTVFDKLLDAADLSRQRLFIVPGNHDVDRDAGRRRGLPRSILNERDAEAYFAEDKPKPHISIKLRAFVNWYNRYFSGLREFPVKSTCELFAPIDINGYTLSLLQLNSVLFCNDSKTDHGQLLLGKGCLEAVLRKHKASPAELSIALMHHPIDSLSWIDRTTVKEALKRDFDLFLQGHNHETEVNRGDLLQLAAGAAYQEAPWPRRALYGRFEKEKREVTVFALSNGGAPHWKWVPDNTAFREEPYHSKTYELSCPSLSVPTPALLYMDDLKQYQASLKKALGTILMIGLPEGLNRVDVNLDDNTFVPLRISWQNDIGNHLEKQPDRGELGVERICMPDDLLGRAFRNRRILLVFGDAGAGKTTLLQYYALRVLDSGRGALPGFSSSLKVFYLQLRELELDKDGSYELLPASLYRWSRMQHHPIGQEIFKSWLESGTSLLLLDGLDEISELDERKRVCSWIDGISNGFEHVCVIVTTRRTGYNINKGIEFVSPHDCAYVQDFIPEQQRLFLKNWFKAALSVGQSEQELADADFQNRICVKAEDLTEKIIKHLADDKHKSLRPLASVPMILQIMAILWKEDHYLPQTRHQLYTSVLNYLLLGRDRNRGIIRSESPLLRMEFNKFLKVLGPIAFWIQSSLKNEQVFKDELRKKMEPELRGLKEKKFTPPSVEEFLDHLVCRAELLLDYKTRSTYEFRHKSFREYLAGIELLRKVRSDQGQHDVLVRNFDDESWEETIRFFISGADDTIFDQFMNCLLDPSVKAEFTQKEKLFLLLLIDEASDKKIDALCRWLLVSRDSQSSDIEKKRMADRQFIILDALYAIGKDDAVEPLQQFIIQRLAANDMVRSRAEAVLLDIGGPEAVSAIVPIVSVSSSDKRKKESLESFLNTNEQNAEYIPIHGGSYLYSATQNEVRVSDLYFAQYPVINKRYRSFIKYLQSQAPDHETLLPVSRFMASLQDIAKSKAWDSDFRKYLNDGKGNLAGLFRSKYDEDRKFGGDDQPVVGVSWYAARAYCLWLSLIESKGNKADLYRLPTEIEWQWAAAGKEQRPYPWILDAEPSSKLANYGNNVGATTPVGSYPDGATTEGLYDMAGNVWEWMENLYDNKKYPGARALRGGSWGNGTDGLRCSARYLYLPAFRSDFFGFRVVRPGLAVEP